MARRPRKTGFDKFFEAQMRDPKVARGYTKARTEVDTIDRIVRALDDARVELGMSKSELASLISAKPEIVRRLFTSKAPNPTLSTVVKLAEALGMKLQLAGAPRRARAPRRRAA
jgi:ribosome-binding protein aMBF1 (putative translation factor)